MAELAAADQGSELLAIREGHYYARPLTVYRGHQDVTDQLGKMIGVSNVIVSTNMRVGASGIPYSDQKRPADSGVAAYFNLHGEPRVLACDRWNGVEENLRAIAKHIEALRGIERWGVGSLEQAFAGFAALPETASRERSWREVFGVPDDFEADADFIEIAYKAKARKCHPDHGGSDEAMAELNRAREQALEEIGL